jgi:hypothetical protein
VSDAERAAAVRAVPGLRVLWSDGTSFLVQTDRELPPTGPADLSRKRLASGPVRISAREDAAPRAPFRATAFSPLVDAVVAEVDSAAYFPWILRLAGAVPVTVGGAGTTFPTRYSYAPECATAEQYVYEQFMAMGFPQVEYDTFQFVPGGAQARNVIATLPGLETPERIYILCGHLDSTSPSPYTSAPGANDNASGTAAVLAGAEILGSRSFRSTIRFIAFTGEEQGLVGSGHYAQMAAAAGDSILGVINCDMISWWGSRYRVDIEGRTIAAPIMQVMDDACRTYTGLATNLLYNAWGSDHVPFLNQGFPAFLAIESDYASYPCYHKTCDSAGQNLAGFGVEVTRASLATLAHLAGIFDPATEAAATGPRGAGLRVQPNPFRGATNVSFAVAAPGRVTLSVHDVSGRLVRSLLDEDRSAGAHVREWDGRAQDGSPAPAGVYFLRLRSGAATVTERLVRVR